MNKELLLEEKIYSMRDMNLLKIHKPLPRYFSGEVYPCDEIVTNPNTSIEVFCDPHTASVYREMLKNIVQYSNLRSDQHENDYLFFYDAICELRAWIKTYSSDLYDELLKYF